MSEETIIDPATGQPQTPQPTDAEGKLIPTPAEPVVTTPVDSATISATHHHVLHGVIVSLEGFARLLKAGFGEFAAEIEALAEKMKAYLNKK